MSRLDFSLRENALSRALASRREPYVDLTESNPTVVGLPAFAAALPPAPVYAPDPRGLLSAREAVGSLHGAAADRVILSASTSEAYSWLFKLLCDPGDEVLVPQPSYPLFDHLASLESVRIVPYALHWDGEWHLDVSQLRPGPRTRAVLVVNPGNPTGAYLKEDERDALARLGLPIISDEVFREFPFLPDERRVSTVAAYDDVLSFALGGLSKSAGLPQLKLGWLVASGPGAGDMLQRLELIADTYLSVNTPVQLAAAGLIANRRGFQEALSSRLARNRAALEAARPANAPWDMLRAEGGWCQILSIPRSRSEEEWALRLLDAGLLVHPGYFFDFASGAHLVVSLLPRPEAFDRGIAVLARVLAE